MKCNKIASYGLLEENTFEYEAFYCDEHYLYADFISCQMRFIPIQQHIGSEIFCHFEIRSLSDLITK